MSILIDCESRVGGLTRPIGTRTSLNLRAVHISTYYEKLAGAYVVRCTLYEHLRTSVYDKRIWPLLVVRRIAHGSIPNST